MIVTDRNDAVFSQEKHKVFIPADMLGYPVGNLQNRPRFAVRAALPGADDVCAVGRIKVQIFEFRHNG